MKRENRYRKFFYGIIWLLLAGILTACTGKEGKTTQIQESESESVSEQLYMITDHDTMDEMLALYNFDTGEEYYYKYDFSTIWKDKYGSYTSAIQFTIGRVVTIAGMNQDGYLTQVQISDEVWEQEKVKRFSIDEEKGIFTIGSTKYSIRENVRIFSDETQIAFSQISEDDILSVVGMEKKILSVVVTTGHGTLALSNTALFEDSFLQLNQNIFALISENMEMEVPEGTYTLKVANNGWGGTTEIEIKRGETTIVDLDGLKGEGKKTGLITFAIDVEEVEVWVDYQLVDHTQPVALTYGTHVLEIKADGYNKWKKYLSVNSEAATLVIELEADEETDTEKETDTEETDSEETDSETEEPSETTSEREESESQNKQPEGTQKEETSSQPEAAEKEETSSQPEPVEEETEDTQPEPVEEETEDMQPETTEKESES